MGNCLTSCLPNNSDNFNALSKSGSDLSALVDEMDDAAAADKRCFISRLFHRRKDRKEVNPEWNSVCFSWGLIALFLEGLNWCGRDAKAATVLPQAVRVAQSLPPEIMRYLLFSRDIQLQFLDARALLSSASLSTRASTPENSLELEWEHETLPCSIIHEASGSSWATSIFPEDTLTTQANRSPLHAVNVTESDYSRVSSSANSLEWDSVQNSVHSEVLDTDTQFLLNEIDRLTMQALKETGAIQGDVSYLDDAL
ncbi:hypothetical protein HUJ04_008620 [Dendroctonus ponderosae]|nr:hypothetical protein HUJ04_008620 [Dendroctonus ponderosae]